MHKSIFKILYLIGFVLIVSSILLFINTGEIYAQGTLSGTTIRQNFYINSATSLKVDGAPTISDTIVMPVYGLTWTDTYFSRPVEGNGEIDSFFPGDTAYLTYKFINRSNDFDTVYIELSDFFYSAPVPSDWQVSIRDESKTIFYGDTQAEIAYIPPDSILTITVAVSIPLNTPEEITGGCTISLFTISSPSGEYSGDNNILYGGNNIITDIDDGQVSYIRVIHKDIKILKPDDIHDTNQEVITISGTCLNAFTGDTVWVYVNDILQDTVNLNSDSSWVSTVTLLPDTLNYVCVKLFDIHGNYKYDTITVNSIITPPAPQNILYSINELYDTSISINLKWSINVPTAIDTQLTFNIYRVTDTDSNILNITPLNYISGAYNGEYNLIIDYDEEYLFLITTVNRYGAEVEGDTILIMYSNINQVRVMGVTYPDTTEIVIHLLDYKGDTIGLYDYETAYINITQLNNLTGTFISNSSIIIDGKAHFEYNKSERGVLTAEFNIAGKQFSVFMFLQKYPAKIPVIFVGESFKNSIGLISIDLDNYQTHYNEYNIIINNPVYQGSVFENIINIANQKIDDNTPYKPTSIITENQIINTHQYLVYDGSGNRIRELPAPIEIIIAYTDDNNDGIIDGTENSGGISVSTLRMFKLNEDNEDWMPVAEYVVDSDNKIVSTIVNNLSIYSIIGTVTQTDISELIVYPNPFKPGIDPEHHYVYFDNIVPGTRLRIFNVVGQLISEGTAPDGAFRMVWDGRNDHGQKVAPGVYVYLLEYENTKKVGKIILVR